mmetsp:Transcript_153043/g.489092  ORF Transcript_153043/g.489092 Transcript_153043/m.489092 type:complete len:275 (-) Transcript_153043:1072-1896(-)
MWFSMQVREATVQMAPRMRRSSTCEGMSDLASVSELSGELATRLRNSDDVLMSQSFLDVCSGSGIHRRTESPICATWVDARVLGGLRRQSRLGLRGGSRERPVGIHLAIACEVRFFVAIISGLQVVHGDASDGERIILVLLGVGKVSPPILCSFKSTTWLVLAELSCHGPQGVRAELEIHGLDGRAQASGLRRHARLQNHRLGDVALNVRREAADIGHRARTLDQHAVGAVAPNTGPTGLPCGRVRDPAVDPVAPVVNDHCKDVWLVGVVLEAL